MNGIIDGFLHGVDTLNEWIGRIIAFIIAVIMLIITYEVIMRYIINAPTIWAWDTNKILFAVMVFLGGGYTLLKKGHVAIDVFYANWSKRRKAITDVITFPVFLLFAGIMVWTLGDMAVESFVTRETVSSAWEPPLYPMKIVVVIGAVLLLVQGIAGFIRNVRFLTTK